jgi:hypothetical protein
MINFLKFPLFFSNEASISSMDFFVISSIALSYLKRLLNIDLTPGLSINNNFLKISIKESSSVCSERPI